MPGPEMLQPSGEALAIETQALAALDVPAEAFTGLPFRLARGERRPLRVPVAEPTVVEVPNGLQVSFVLPRGSYATSVLRELLEETIWFGGD
jgi:tRNA pseudouridine13 synthase